MTQHDFIREWRGKGRIPALVQSVPKQAAEPFRTLTVLCNARAPWLKQAHTMLDQAAANGRDGGWRAGERRAGA